jgi:hypothetical protein
MTRAQVVAETRAAGCFGLLVKRGEVGRSWQPGANASDRARRLAGRPRRGLQMIGWVAR